MRRQNIKKAEYFSVKTQETGNTNSQLWLSQPTNIKDSSLNNVRISGPILLNITFSMRINEFLAQKLWICRSFFQLWESVVTCQSVRMHEIASGCDINNNKLNTTQMIGDDERYLLWATFNLDYCSCRNSDTIKPATLTFVAPISCSLLCLYAKILTAQSTNLSKLSCSTGLTILYSPIVYENVLLMLANSLMLAVAWYSYCTVIIMHYIVKGTQLLLWFLLDFIVLWLA